MFERNQLERHLYSSLRLRDAELILLFAIDHIEPKPISYSVVFLLYLHLSLHWLPPLHCLFDYSVNLVQIDPLFTDEVVITHQIPIPYLDGKDVGVHILRFLRVMYGEFHTIVEISN